MKMKIINEEELWNEITDYDCGDTGVESIAYFNGDKKKKWVAVDDILDYIDRNYVKGNYRIVRDLMGQLTTTKGEKK